MNELLIFCDGACYPPYIGVPTYGYVLYHDGRWIHEDCGLWEHKGTSNVAEYGAVIKALEYLADAGLTFHSVEVRSDSNLVINQLTGRWKIHAEHLRLLHNQVKDLERQFKSVVYRWTPREKNEYADLLSKAVTT